MGPGDFLKVTYEGRNVKQRDGSVEFDDETPFSFVWDSRPYQAEVGKETFVPFEAVALAMGDPRSGESVASVRDEAGNVMFVVDRATELRRLTIYYDNAVEDDDITPLYAPQATVTDLEGEEVKMVLHDPTGDSVTPVQTTVLDREQLMQQIQRQQRLIEQLADEQGVDLPAEDETDIDTTKDGVDDRTDPFKSVPEG